MLSRIQSSAMLTFFSFYEQIKLTSFLSGFMRTKNP